MCSIKCPNCNSNNCRSIDNEPLSHDRNWLKESNLNHDPEIYMSFSCESCGHGFRETLAVSSKKARSPKIEDIDSRIPEGTPFLRPVEIEAWENEVLLINGEGQVLAQLDPAGNFTLAEILKLAKLLRASYFLLRACKSARTDMEMLVNGECNYSVEGAQSTIKSLTKAINIAGLMEENAEIPYLLKNTSSHF